MAITLYARERGLRFLHSSPILENNQKIGCEPEEWSGTGAGVNNWKCGKVYSTLLRKHPAVIEGVAVESIKLDHKRDTYAVAQEPQQQQTHHFLVHFAKVEEVDEEDDDEKW